jgi:folate-binding protein YgfZ
LHPRDIFYIIIKFLHLRETDQYDLTVTNSVTRSKYGFYTEKFMVKPDKLLQLSHLGLIKAAGPDAEKFLQSQLTCDLREVDEDNTRLGAYCNPQGRILACFRLLKWQNNFYLVMPEEIIAPTLTVLKKYAVFSKVIISDASSDFAILGCIGVLPPLKKRALSQSETGVIEEQFIYSVPPTKTEARYEIIVLREALPSLYAELVTEPQNRSYWDYLDINAGLPCIYKETIACFTPQQINYPALGGVSFQKGCYPGQEIVARMHYLGKIKQHLYHATLAAAGVVPLPGIELCDAAGQVVGNIVRVSDYDPSLYHLLAVVQDSARQGDIFIKDTACRVVF